MVDGSDDVIFSSIDDEADEDFAAASVDPRFTFESFVAGKSNEFVFAAAKAVAKAPGSGFNPLYIYGASGLGKTHLFAGDRQLHRRAQALAAVLYTTCEKFINELIDSIYLNKGQQPRPARRDSATATAA